MLFGRRKDGVSQDFPTAFAKSQASLGGLFQSRAPSESGPTIALHATKRLQLVDNLINISSENGVAGCESRISGR
jgi:hypothetical protein